MNCHWHATQVFTTDHFGPDDVVFKRSICVCSIVEERAKFCVISSRSFNLSTPPSHLNIEEFPTLIIPTQPKSEQLLQNQLANRLNLNLIKITDLRKGKCGLLPIHPSVFFVWRNLFYTSFLGLAKDHTSPFFCILLLFVSLIMVSQTPGKYNNSLEVRAKLLLSSD